MLPQTDPKHGSDLSQRVAFQQLQALSRDVRLGPVSCIPYSSLSELRTPLFCFPYFTAFHHF
jgi:hypothetical protein